ncbi:MAG: hypothetical protein ACTSU2_07660 [Promethearchaeota archaeon]
MRVYLPSEDELAIIKVKSKFVDQLGRVIDNEENEMKVIKVFADNLKKTVNSKRTLVQIQEELIKKLEIASRNPASRISKDEIKSIQKSMELLSNSINNQSDLAYAFLDLNNSMKEFLKKKRDYLKLYSKLISLESKWQNLVYQYIKEKNRFVDENKLAKTELKIQDIYKDIERLEGQLERKIEYIIQESKILEGAWQNLKKAIKTFGW